MEMKLEK